MATEPTMEQRMQALALKEKKSAATGVVQQSVRRLRVTLRPAEDAAIVSSIWADVVEGDGVRLVRLLHDYPDLKLEPGWLVSGRDLDGVVRRVDGRDLWC